MSLPAMSVAMHAAASSCLHTRWSPPLDARAEAQRAGAPENLSASATNVRVARAMALGQAGRIQ
jgi:hypothetical protein